MKTITFTFEEAKGFFNCKECTEEECDCVWDATSSIICTHCGKAIFMFCNNQDAGKEVHCPHCGNMSANKFHKQ